MSQFAIPLAALIVSVTTLIMTGLSMRKGAIRTYMTDLEARIRLVEANLSECERNRVELRNREIELMTKIVQLQKI